MVKKTMKKISVKHTLLLFLLLFLGVFSIILSSTPVSFQKITRTSENFNIKVSTVSFSNATVISDGYGGVYWNNDGSYNPSFAVDSTDTVHAVWLDLTDGIWGTDYEIMHAYYTTVSGWSNATVISDGFGGVYWNDGWSATPAIAVDSNDTVHVVWYDGTDGIWGTDYEIMYVTYTTVSGWSNITVISDGFGGVYWNNDGSFNPAIAVDSNNAVHVVWYDFTAGIWGGGGDSEIMYVTYTTVSGWSNATVISDGFGGVYWNDKNSFSPAIAVDSNNAVHVVWYDLTDGIWGTDVEIMYADYTTVSGWSNATVISDGFGGVYWNDGASTHPAIAVDSNDVVHVVWEDDTAGTWGADTEIMYANYTSTMDWSNISIISDGHNNIYWNNGESVHPAIAVDSNNVVHVVWSDYTIGGWGGGVTDSEIMHTEYTSISGWSLPLVISDGFGGVFWNDAPSSLPFITAGTDKVYIVWGDETDGVWGTDTEIMFTSISIPAPPITTTGTIPGYNIFILLFGVFAVTYLFIRRKQKKTK